MANLRIPLFPLNVVLLPGKVLPLHIFEPRYKSMIGNAIEQKTPFGVVRAHNEGISRIGCTALVTRVIKTHDDGRMDIETKGQDVFRISEVHEEKPYLEATVEMLTDDLDPGPADFAATVRDLFEQCYLLVNTEPPPAVDVETGASLAYRLACELPLDLDALQDLLSTRSEANRQKRLTEYLNKLRQRLVRTAQMQARASGNGHGLN